MALHLSWEQIALRLVLAAVASFIIGFNRDEHGHPAGIRTTMLVCLAATIAMLQVNLLLPMTGKSADSFITMDLMRLPLGILSGIGFIGAGVIIKHGGRINGVTTAATIWFVTVLGLLFGAGNLFLGIFGSLIAIAILWFLKYIENYLPREYRGFLHLTLSSDFSTESEIRQRLVAAKWVIAQWHAQYEPANTLIRLDCEVRWKARKSHIPETPPSLDHLRSLPGVQSLSWKE